jgi:hypothetical protein
MSKNISLVAATAILILSGCGGGSGVDKVVDMESNMSSVSSTQSILASSSVATNNTTTSSLSSQASVSSANNQILPEVDVTPSGNIPSSVEANAQSSMAMAVSSTQNVLSSSAAVSSSAVVSSAQSSAVSSAKASSSSVAVSSTQSAASSTGAFNATAWYQPGVKTTWQWQLQGTINKSYDVNVYDIDVFDTSAATISTLHADGRKVICYFSAGSYEAWREDAKDFPEEALGSKMDGWDERWIDIRNKTVRSIMAARMDLAKSKGCDGVEPDNVDGYDNNNGLGLTASDQIDYNTFLAQSAHNRGLAVGLKNDVEQVAALEPYFDFCVNEECHDYDECDVLASFISHKKPVFNAEYASKYKTAATLNSLCADAKNRQFQTLYLPLDLDDSFRYSCSE